MVGLVFDAFEGALLGIELHISDPLLPIIVIDFDAQYLTILGECLRDAQFSETLFQLFVLIYVRTSEIRMLASGSRVDISKYWFTLTILPPISIVPYCCNDIIA